MNAAPRIAHAIERCRTLPPVTARQAALSVAMALCIQGCSPRSDGEAQAAASPSVATASTPIRVVLHQTANLAYYWPILESQHGLCRVSQHLPEQPLPAFDEAKKQSFYAIRSEELFDGDKHAKFESQSVLAADPTHKCAIVQTTTYTAVAEVGCKTAWRGSAKPSDDDKRTPEVVVEDDQPSQTTCPTSATSDDIPPGVPTYSVGQGADCVRPDDIGNVKAKRPVSKEATGLTPCLYAKQPYYRGNAQAPVVVQIKAPDAIDREAAKPLNERQPRPMDIGTSVLDAFSDHAPIASDRFTRAAVDAWVRQPLSKVVTP